MNNGPSHEDTLEDEGTSGNFDDLGSFLDSLQSEAREYLGTQRELLEAKTYHRVAKLVGGLLNGLLAAVLLFGLLVFLSIALALWLGSVMGSSALGFLAVGGLFLLIFLVFRLTWQHGLKERFTLNIINDLYDEKD